MDVRLPSPPTPSLPPPPPPLSSQPVPSMPPPPPPPPLPLLPPPSPPPSPTSALLLTSTPIPARAPGAYTRPLSSSTYAVLVTQSRVPLSNRLGENHAHNVFTLNRIVDESKPLPRALAKVQVVQHDRRQHHDAHQKDEHRADLPRAIWPQDDIAYFLYQRSSSPKALTW